jgi:hypothetical protein
MIKSGKIKSSIGVETSKEGKSKVANAIKFNEKY